MSAEGGPGDDPATARRCSLTQRRSWLRFLADERNAHRATRPTARPPTLPTITPIGGDVLEAGPPGVTIDVRIGELDDELRRTGAGDELDELDDELLDDELDDDELDDDELLDDELVNLRVPPQHDELDDDPDDVLAAFASVVPVNVLRGPRAL
jgi:hypothetical protein